MLQNRLFFALASRSGFGATISDAIARSSLVFCNSVSADRIGMAAARSFEGSLARNAFLALVIFLLKIFLKSASKSSFFRSGVEIRFWSYNFRRRCAQFYCVLQLSLCRSHCNSCVKVASCCGCIRNTVFCSWISEIVLEWLHEGCEMDLLADFLHFGLSVFLLYVGLEQCEVWGVKSAV